MDIPLPQPADWKAGFEPRKTSNSQSPYLEYTGHLEISPSDTRQYRLLKLPNNIKVVCVHDADAKTAAASLSVNIGSYDEPKELMGLAHFCEHLLFMGSEKYPKEDEYHSYISNNGGFCNAYTDFSNTCYYFSIVNDALEGALDRFSQIFTAPRFDPDCVDRELNAVDSEFKGYLQNDGWRTHQIFKTTTNPDHPHALFDVGNLETLKAASERLGINLRDEIIKFYNKYYSADIMNLCVVSQHSLDQIAEWAVAMFSPISSKGNTKPQHEGHPLPPGNLGTLIRYKTINDIYQIFLQFALPDMRSMEMSCPLSYICRLLGFSGHGSITSYLIKRGWATSITAGTMSRLHTGYNIFTITVSAMPKGLENYKSIVSLVFAYLKLMKDSGLQDWFYDEVGRIKKIKYRFIEKGSAEDLAVGFAEDMHSEFLPPSKIRSYGYLQEPFDGPRIAQILELLNPGNMRILLGAMDHGVECPEKEAHFGVNYRVDAIPRELIDELNGPLQLDALRLPEPNKYIADNLDVDRPVALPTPAKEPVLLKLTDMAEVWFKKDDQFFLPRGNITICFDRSPVGSSPHTAGACDILQSMVYRILDEEFCYASTAGLRFSFRSHTDGVVVGVSGFNDKLAKLLEGILCTIKAFKAEKAMFDFYMEAIKKFYQNLKNSGPENISDWDMYYLNLHPAYHYNDILAELDSVTIDQVQSIADHLFERVRIKMLVAGNFAEEDALQMIERVISIVNPGELPNYLRSHLRAVDIQPGSYLRQITMPNDDDVNSAIIYEIKTRGRAGLKEDISMSVLSTIMHDIFFDQLRTKEQLGYAVACYDSRYASSGSKCIRFEVKSESNPAYLQLRIKSFIRGFRKQLEDLELKKFESQVDSLIKRLEEKLKSIGQEADEFWHHINNGIYEFDKKQTAVAHLKELELQDLLELWDKWISSENSTVYTEVISRVWSTKIPCPSDKELQGYPDTSIALYGCLHHDGATELTLEDVHGYISRMPANAETNSDNSKDKDRSASDSSSLDDLVEWYRQSANTAVADGRSKRSAEDIDGVCKKLAEKSSQIKTALAMAIEASSASAATTNGKPLTNGIASGDESTDGTACACTSSLENIGMFKTYGGAWVINDYLAFKKTQPLCGIPLPARKLVPKYPAA